jgi:hypothetical protein
VRTYSYDANAPAEGADLVQRQLLLAARYRDRLVAIELARRDAVWAGADRDAAKAAATAARTTLYNDAGGLHWGTRAAVTDAADRAFSDVRDFAAGPDKRQQKGDEPLKPMTCGRCREPYAEGERVWWSKGAHRLTGCPRCEPPLRFLPFEGTGTVAVQLQGDTDPLEDGGQERKGCSVRELLVDGHGQFRLEAGVDRRHRVAWIRVGSAGREPVWAKVPIVYHRDLPLGAVVKAARLLCYRVATHVRWSVQFMLDDVPSTFPAPSRERIGIDVGWRLFPDRMRVACWADSAGRTGELSIPERLLDRWTKCEDLRSIQDKHLLAALDDLVTTRRVEWDKWPRWLYETTATAWQWRSRDRLVRLAERLRTETEPHALALYTRLEEWRKQDNHLWEWEANQRENVLRARREIYRVFAAKTVALYEEVRVEALDLRDFAELPDTERGDKSDEPITANARGRRFKACLSELIGSMRDATLRAGGVWAQVDPALTTQWCAACGREDRFDAAREVRHTCSSCGAEWDQDENAALNILRAPPERTVSTERSQDEKAKKSARSHRRAEGLAKSRAARREERERRSQESVEAQEVREDAP